jgi:SAM-dependent methyltransferase
MASPTDWWNGFFSGLFAEFWRAAIPAEATRAEVDFLQSRLGLEPGKRVLDAPCGHGRHSLELARRGLRVTGIDSSGELLTAARGDAAHEGLAVEWLERDMRDLPWHGEFDAAFCAGNSFGYFDDEGNQAFLGAVARALRPGGRFLLESGWVAESLFPNFPERLDMEVAGIRFQAENRYDPVGGRVENRFTASRRDQCETRPAVHGLYTCRDICRMLEAEGFTDPEAFGSTAGEPFRIGSPRLLLVATRRASKRRRRGELSVGAPSTAARRKRRPSSGAAARLAIDEPVRDRLRIRRRPPDFVARRSCASPPE